MNVNDITEIPESKDFLVDMFKKQKELLDKYHLIEHKVLKIDELNIHPDDPINLVNATVQFKVKGHLARVAEELAESYQVVYNVRNGIDEDNKEHQREEAIDATHFLIESFLVTHTDQKHLDPLEDIEKRYIVYKSVLEGKGEDEKVDFMYNQSFYHILISLNLFRNKPWKVSQVLFDEVRFIEHMVRSFEHLMYLLFFLGLKPADVYNLYFKKSCVNDFRIKSRY